MNLDKLAYRYSPMLRRRLRNPYTTPELKQALESFVKHNEAWLIQINQAHSNYVKLLKPYQTRIQQICRASYLESLGIKPLSQTEKKRIIREKGSRCELCDSSNSLEVHHKPLNHVFYSPTDYAKFHNDKANLLVVCRSCHVKLDSDRARFSRSINAN